MEDEQFASDELLESITEANIRTIEDWMQSDWKFRCAAMKLCEDESVPIPFIERGLRDNNPQVSREAKVVCKKRPIPRSVIDKWISDSNDNVRTGGLIAIGGTGNEKKISAALIGNFIDVESNVRETADAAKMIVEIISMVMELSQEKGWFGSCMLAMSFFSKYLPSQDQTETRCNCE